MIQNKERVGNPTSSQMWKLMTNNKAKTDFGAPGLTYIKEKTIERKLGRSIETSSYSKDMQWGLFLEKRVHSLLPDFGYKLTSKQTDVHPKYDFWAGSKDLILPKVKVGDIKCYQPKNFSILVDAILRKSIEHLKESHAKEYWQIVSNAAINQVPNGEIISYMPYQSELEEIREMAANVDDPGNEWKYRFIYESEDYDLAFLPDGGFYKNLNTFEFEVPKEDIELLTERIVKANEMILESLTPKVMIAEYDQEIKATIID